MINRMNPIKFTLDNSEYKIEKFTHGNFKVYGLFKFDKGGKCVVRRGKSSITKPNWEIIGYYPSVDIILRVLLDEHFSIMENLNKLSEKL